MPQLEWTPAMGPAPIADHLDAQTRVATLAAFMCLENAPRGASPAERDQRPRWHIGTYANPGNPAAEAMLAATLVGVTATGDDRRRVLTCAVRLAIVAHDAGGGVKGWTAMAAMLPAAAQARTKVLAATRKR